MRHQPGAIVDGIKLGEANKYTLYGTTTIRSKHSVIAFQNDWEHHIYIEEFNHPISEFWGNLALTWR